MIKNWITFGMSSYITPGFQDTSRLMTRAWYGTKIYIEPPKSFYAWLKLDGKAVHWTTENRGETTVIQPPLPVPARFDPYRWSVSLQAKKFNQEMTRILGQAWRDTSLVYITNWTPFLEPLLSKVKPKYLVTDFVDDVLSFPYDWDVKRVTESYKKLVNISSTVVAVSPVLQEKIRKQYWRTAIVLPNGVSDAFFSSKKEVPKLIQKIDRKCNRRIGFAGTLNHWIDFESIRHLANLYPENNFYLMGKRGHMGSSEQAQQFEKLLETSNVFALGPIPYEELPDYLHHMDALLLPRHISDSSGASSPLKLYEYLAVGKPIVSCGFPVPTEIVPFIYHSQTKEGLERSMHMAIQEKGLNTKARQAFAKKHTWKRRVQAVVNLVQNDDSALKEIAK